MRRYVVAEESVLYQQNELVAVITLNRPRALNSFDAEMAARFIKYLEQARDDESARAILIRANGRAFSSGQDLAEVRKQPDMKLGEQ